MAQQRRKHHRGINKHMKASKRGVTSACIGGWRQRKRSNSVMASSRRNIGAAYGIMA